MLAKDWFALAEHSRKKLGDQEISSSLLMQKALYYYGVSLYKQGKYK